MSVSIDELRDLGLVNIDYPENLRIAVENAVASWKAFCRLPREEKCALPFAKITMEMERVTN